MGTAGCRPHGASCCVFQYPIHGSDHGNDSSCPPKPSHRNFQYPIHGSDHGNGCRCGCGVGAKVFQYPIHGSDHGNRPRRGAHVAGKLTCDGVACPVGTSGGLAEPHGRAPHRRPRRPPVANRLLLAQAPGLRRVAGRARRGAATSETVRPRARPGGR